MAKVNSNRKHIYWILMDFEVNIFLSVFESDVVGVVSFRVRLDRTYFAETENWKHCSKIIFKCMNSTLRHIFNEKVAEKWDLWVLWIVHETHWYAEKSNIVAIVHE